MNERTTNADANADGVLSPEDLAPDEDRLTVLDENRFVVTANEGTPANTYGGENRLPDVDPAIIPDGGSDTWDRDRSTSGSTDPADTLANASAQYGVDVTVKTDDGIAREQLTSNDIRVVFTKLLRWYAQQLDDELPAEETLQILLDASDLEVTY
ncbi:DUF7500 family protein [Haloarchaeobius amylolyticus]|uniref:DUF7500 family protein n=1 Tax=Haloarchaeobius amylolyticus TaxID=1198296 RepID=UPI00226E06A3|nr:hypothetical protein [Haloarchaeobius amylolyticus]